MVYREIEILTGLIDLLVYYEVHQGKREVKQNFDNYVRNLVTL